MRIVEWNLHGMTGTGVGGNKYSIPTKLIENSIKGIKGDMPDVIVFTEFVYKNTNETNSQEEPMLKTENYDVYWTQQDKRRNGICIAVKRKQGLENFKYVFEGEKTSDFPDLLAVGNDEIKIFGVRFHSESTNKCVSNLIEKVKKYENNKCKIILVGDFNKFENKVIKKYSEEDCNNAIRICKVSDSKDCNGIIEQAKLSILDHILTTFDFNDVAINYNWDFMIQIYDYISDKATYLNRRCIPDHAMLIAELEI